MNGIPQRFSICSIALYLLFCAGLTSALAQQSPNAITQSGVSVAFSLQTLQPGEATEGTDAIFRFALTDTTTGAPLRNSRPAAWLNAQRAGVCTQKAAAFLSGSLLTPPALNLNVYYLLALNQDATISVVDPLFGFGGTKLLAMVFLKAPGEDWALTADQKLLFVSMPDAGQVAVVDAASWKVLANLDAGTRLSRLALQPDGRYLWAASDSGPQSGVAAINVAERKVAARIATASGQHDLAISDDNRFVFVTNREAGTVSIIDAIKLAKIADLDVGREPVSIAFSTAGQLAYAALGDGGIAAISGPKAAIVTRLTAEPGLSQIRFAPGGRFAFIANPARDRVHILDAATNRLVQTAGITQGPEQIAFSDKLAYVRRRASETVLMIPLDQIGAEGQSVPVVDFPAGQQPFGKGAKSSLAGGIVQAPGAPAVLVANPADKAIYYYKEGMAAPMGTFSNYGREPRAVLVVDRSLQEHAPGVYETVARLPRAGRYDVVFFLDAPRLVHCFELSIAPNPALSQTSQPRPVMIQSLLKDRAMRAGEKVRVQFRLLDAGTKQPRTGVTDLRALAFLSPGIWQRRVLAEARDGGVYEIEFAPPEPGLYYIYLESASLGLKLNNPQYLTIEVKPSSGG